MALITFSPKYKGKRAMAVPADKAKTIYANWQNPTGDLSEEQLDMLGCIEHIYFNKHNAKKQELTITEQATSHLTHTGIEQGKNQALPIGDR